jgi:hypothetical protein
MMKNANTIAGYLGGGYIQPLGYQRGGRAARNVLGRAHIRKKGQEARGLIEDATTEAKGFKDKMMGWGKGAAGLASIVAPRVLDAFVPGLGVGAQALLTGALVGGSRIAGEAAAGAMSKPESTERIGWGSESLDKISDYRSGLSDKRLQRGLASGAMSGLGAYAKGGGFDKFLPKTKAPTLTEQFTDSSGNLIASPEAYKTTLGMSPEAGASNFTAGLSEFAPKTRAGMTGYSEGFSFGDLSQSNLTGPNPYGEFIPEDVVLNDYFDQFNQQGGMINGYMGGGMISQRKNYRGGGLISMMPFSRRIV